MLEDEIFCSASDSWLEVCSILPQHASHVMVSPADKISTQSTRLFQKEITLICLNSLVWYLYSHIRGTIEY